MTYEFHPIASIFTLIDGQSFEDLVADVSKHGVREPIWVYEGKILDGRNRYRAALAAGVDCPVREYTGDNAVEFVVSLNLYRRHLNESQRAMVAARLANMSQGERTDLEPCANLRKVSQSDAAEKLNVSRRIVQSATEVKEEAIPEIVQAVDDGRISVSAASNIATLPKEEQEEIVREIDSGEKPSDVIKKHVLATKHTGDEESYTPIEYLESAREVLGKFDLDPASNKMAQENVRADLFYTVDDNGLDKEWSGKVWMNPPYTARVINTFVSKLVDHYKDGDITDAIVLTNNNTDTSWFHEAANTASAVCFTAGRINFLKRDGSRSSPTNGQSFIYFGKDIEKFKSVFSKHGIVMVKA